MNYLLPSFLSFLLLIVSCSDARKDETQEKSIKQTSEQDSFFSENENLENTDSLREIIGKVAMSIHNWYIPISLSMDYETSTFREIIEGESGKCVLDHSGYFQELRDLGTMSERFLETEIERTKTCAEFIATLKWEDYQNAEGYDYIDSCQHFYYRYWTSAQDDYDGVAVDEMNQLKSEKWAVTLALYNDFEERTYNRDKQPKMTVVKENGHWVITEMVWQ